MKLLAVLVLCLSLAAQTWGRSSRPMRSVNSCSRIDCNLNPSIEYYPSPTECTSFCRCSNGVPYPQTCPAGLHFNTKINVCDWTEAASCAIGQPQSTQAPEVPEPTPGQVPEEPHEPATCEPVTTESEPTDPATTKPTTTQPATTKPTTTQPATTKPTTTQPATTKPTTTQPATTKPTTKQSATAKPTTTKPAKTTKTPIKTTRASGINCADNSTYPFPNDPTSYYKCTQILGHWHRYDYTCPQSGCFNATSRLCQLGICPTKTTAPHTTTLLTTMNAVPMTPTPVIPPAPNTCIVPGTFPNKAKCSMYFKCVSSGGTLLRFDYTCPAMTFFNPTTKLCTLGPCPL